MPHLEIALLGPPHITQDACPLAAPLWNKTLALLAYLAIESDRPHRREALAGLLWAEEPEAAARHSLRQALNQLRQALQEDEAALAITARTVHWCGQPGVSVDVDRFQALLSACRAHPHRHAENCPACAARLEQAAALYRGDLLAGFSLRDSPAFDEWAAVQRERLSREALGALYGLAQYAGRHADYERMERAARRQVEIDPFREKAHRQLLAALAWSGQTSTALSHYAALEQLLRAELDAPPEDETTTLVERIRSGSLERPVPVPLRNWPAAPTPLVGRAAELAGLATLLPSPSTRLLTIVGVGGVGKTRMALAAAEQAAPAFAAGACFVPLAAVSAPEYVAPAVAAALGLPLGAAEPRARLRGYLEDKDLLLVLDGMEHLLEAAPLVAELLAACPHLTVLATSREPLHLRSEQQLRLAPLALPDPERLPGGGDALVAALAAIPAVELFVQRARAVQPGFALDPDNAAVVAAICAHLEGLPLAIELAAARLDGLTLAEMLRRQESRLAFLVDGFRDLPPRQRTLRATLDWSYDLLASREKDLLADLAVFSGGCTLEAVQAVCRAGAAANLEGDMGSLVGKSLLRFAGQVEGQSWFAMLDVVQEYARERLAEQGRERAAAEQHARYYRGLAERAAPCLAGAQRESWFNRLRAERSNVRAALQWAEQGGDPDLVMPMAGALWLFWEIEGDYTEGRRWLEAAVRTPPAGPAGRAEPWARALNGAGVLAGEQCDFALAVSRLEQSLALYRQLGDERQVASVLAWLAWAAGEMGDDGRAVAAYEECLALEEHRAGGPRPGTVGFVLNGLGNLAHFRGDYAAARSYLERALAIRRAAGDAYGVTCALYNLGSVARSMEEYERAAALLHDSLERAWEGESEVHIAWCMLEIAAVLLAQGRLDQAARLFGRAERLFRSLDFALGEGNRRAYAQLTAGVRTGLPEERWAAALAAGAALPLAQAVAETLAAYRIVPPPSTSSPR